MPKNWFSIQARGAAAAEIAIFDEIGAFGVTAKDFIAALGSLTASHITLSINSPGGSVFDALAIYNAVKQHPAKVTVKVLGLAASAASLVTMAGDKIVMPENAFMMIHNPMAGFFGNADAMREMADVIDKIGASLVATYAQRTGQAEDKIRELLAAETWLDAQEALALGFADEIEQAMHLAASFDLERLPERVQASFQQPAAISLPPALASEISAMVAAANLKEFADVLLLDPSIQTIEQARSRIDEARDIKALCLCCGTLDQAAGFISARKSYAEVRAAVAAAKAAASDALVTDNHPPMARNPVISQASEIWKRRRGLQ